MIKLMISSLLLVLSTGAFAQALSQVMPGTWRGNMVLKIDPRGSNNEMPKEFRMLRDPGNDFTIYPVGCETAELQQSLQPLAQFAYEKNQVVVAEIKMKGDFAIDGTTSGMVSITYSTTDYAAVVNCTTVSPKEQVMIDDAQSEMVDVNSGERTKVTVVNMNEIIVHSK